MPCNVASALDLHCLSGFHLWSSGPGYAKTLSHMQTTKVQVSLRICAAWSAPLLFAAYIVWYVYLLYPKFQDSSKLVYLSRLVWMLPGQKSPKTHFRLMWLIYGMLGKGVNQFRKGENSLMVAKFYHSYSNSPAVFKEFKNIEDLSNWLSNSAVMVPCANWHAQYVCVLFRLRTTHLLTVRYIETTTTNAHVHTCNLYF